MIILKKLTPEEKAKIVDKFPQSHPLDYAVYEDDLLFAYYDNEAEAQKDMVALRTEEEISQKFHDWVVGMEGQGYVYRDIVRVVESA